MGLPRRLPFLVLMVFAATANLIYADEPRAATTEEKKNEQLINELFVGEKLYIQDKGEWVLIATPSFSHASDEKETEVSGELKYGLTERLQLSGEIPWVLMNPDNGNQEDGIGDISVAVNYNFIQEDKWALGVRSEFVFPTGSQRRGIGDGTLAWEPSLLSSIRLGEGEIYAGVGAIINDNDEQGVSYSIAGAYPWRQFVGVLEFSGENIAGSAAAYIVPGFYYRVREHFDVGFGVPIGVTDGADDYQLVAKLVFEF